jgi:hypothetical protein
MKIFEVEIPVTVRLAGNSLPDAKTVMRVCVKMGDLATGWDAVHELERKLGSVCDGTEVDALEERVRALETA